MEPEDETNQILPDPPFEVQFLFQSRRLTLLIVPTWNQEKDAAEFEVFAGPASLGLIRRSKYIMGWDIISGEFADGLEEEIGDKIDDHYN